MHPVFFGPNSRMLNLNPTLKVEHPEHPPERPHRRDALPEDGTPSHGRTIPNRWAVPRQCTSPESTARTPSTTILGYSHPPDVNQPPRH